MDEPSPTFQLFEFRYEGNHPQSIRFLQWLFRHQYEHHELGTYLRILHLSVPLADDSQGELASMYGRHLHSLRMLRPDWTLIKSATSLREIYLRHDEDISDILLVSLPPSIEHIACTTHNNRTTAVERVLQQKEFGRSLGSLRAMTLYCPKTDWQADWESRWSRLCIRAQRAGFDLVRQDDRSFLVGGVSLIFYTAISILTFLLFAERGSRSDGEISSTSHCPTIRADGTCLECSSSSIHGNRR